MQMEGTTRGLMLLILGAILAWIPFVSLIGGILSLAGAILIVLGRKAFGRVHSRNVVVAAVLYLAGLIGEVVLLGSLWTGIVQAASLPPDQAKSAIASAFNVVSLEGMVVAAVTGLALVFLLHALLDQRGKVLIWLAVVAQIAVQVVVYALTLNQLGPALADAFSTTTPNLGPLESLDSQINTLHMLTVVPSLLSAGAAYLALKSIDHKPIPERLRWDTPT